MKKPITLFAITATLLISIGYLMSEQQQANTDITTVKVTDKIYMLQGDGGNIGVSVGEDGILMIDDKFARHAPNIEKALKDLNTGSLKYLLNTHYHGDHTGSNEIFGKMSTIVAHNNVRQRLSTEQMRRGQPDPPKPKAAWPVITFDSSVSLHFNGEEIKAMHYPNGHTDGDAVIYFTQSNVVHMGDDFFVGRFPYIDLGAGGSVLGLIKAIENVIANVPADVKIIPGHGDLSTLEDLKAYHGMLKETSAIVQEKIKAGKSVDAIKSEGLPEKWQEWGSGFIKQDGWLETLHTSLSR